MCYQWMMSFFTLEAQQDVGDPDNLVAGRISEQEVEIVPAHQARRRVAYASNCENSQWLMLGAELRTPKVCPT